MKKLAKAKANPPKTANTYKGTVQGKATVSSKIAPSKLDKLSKNAKIEPQCKAIPDASMILLRSQIKNSFKRFVHLPDNYYYAQFGMDKLSNFIKVFSCKDKTVLLLRIFKYDITVNFIMHRNFLFALYETMLRVELCPKGYNIVDLNWKDLMPNAWCSDNKKYLYLCGSQNDQNTKSCQRYSVEANKCTNLPDLMEEGVIHTCCYLHPKLYICFYNTKSKKAFPYMLKTEPIGQQWIKINMELSQEPLTSVPIPSDIIIFYRICDPKTKELWYYNDHTGKAGAILKSQHAYWWNNVIHTNNGMNAHGMAALNLRFSSDYTRYGNDYTTETLGVWTRVYDKL